jgi:hypothetical protein
MTGPLQASIVDLVLGLATTPAGHAPDNRLTVEGLAFGPGSDGTLEIRVARLAAASLRLASGPLTLEIGQFAVHQLSARIGFEGIRPRLRGLEAAGAELSGLKLQRPLDLARPAAGARHRHGTPGPAAKGAWRLEPLAAADGTLHAEIVDATLIFDANVRVEIRQGQVDFNQATVEHVGPDSRMGVSHLGFYVDAPNGRSYLYQFQSAPVAGVEYERRSALPGPWGSKRGSLRLQEFGEWLLRQAPSGAGQGVTDQARLLLGRTAAAGHVQLGDGRITAPGAQAELTGRAAGHNVVRVKSEAVGRGLDIELASLSVRNAAASWGDMQLGCDEIAGALVLQLTMEGTSLRAGIEVAKMNLSGLRLYHAARGTG